VYSEDEPSEIVSRPSTGVNSPTHIVRLASTNGRQVVVGDLLQSILLAEVDDDGTVLDIKRDTSNLLTGSLAISNSQILVGDLLGCIHQLQNVDEAVKLAHEGTFNIREAAITNMLAAEPHQRWNPVVSAQHSDIVDVRFYFSTVKGGLYFHGVIKEDYAEVLRALQNNLSYVVEFVKCNDSTNKSRRRYYNFHRHVNEKKDQDTNILDGELLLEYLKLSSDSRLWCLQGQFKGGVPISIPDDDVLRMVRALRGLA
jgi:CPSF A subunit region